jgi:hypothetical protein
MNQIVQQMAETYAGMSAEEILADMQASGAHEQFADPWLVASYLAHLAGQ